MIRLTRRPLRLAILALAPAVLVSACSGSDPEPKEGDEVFGGLGEEIMVDPDLAGSNGANSAATAEDRSVALPANLLTPEAITRAKTEALKVMGGPGSEQEAPAAREVNGTLPADAVLTAAARAAATPGGDINCAEKAQYTMDWAGKLPATFPVYPMGQVQEAAGTDEDACALRVVNYLTAVSLDDVMNFYYSKAKAAGFSTQRVREANDDILGGTKGEASYVVYARKLATGGTEVDLVTNGG